MARWYSKLRKARYSYEIRTYGCIPGFTKIALGMRNPFGGLETCDYDDECDFCDRPSKGTYASISGYYEPEVDFCICGRCAVRGYYKEAVRNHRSFSHYSNFHQWKRRQALKPGQHICDWCDQTFEGDCDCNGARYHREHQQTA